MPDRIFIEGKKKGLIKKIINGKYAHIFQCDICYEMTRREYKNEEDYFEDLFRGKLKPVKYKLVMFINKKIFDSWMVCLEGKKK